MPLNSWLRLRGPAVCIEAEVDPPSCWPPPPLDSSSSEAHGIRLQTVKASSEDRRLFAPSMAANLCSWSPAIGHDASGSASGFAFRRPKFCTPFCFRAVHPAMKFPLYDVRLVSLFDQATCAPRGRVSALRFSAMPLSCKEFPRRRDASVRVSCTA